MFVYIRVFTFSLFLFNGISTLMGYLMPNSPLYKDSSGTFKLIVKNVLTFPKSICPKMNVIA